MLPNEVIFQYLHYISVKRNLSHTFCGTSLFYRSELKISQNRRIDVTLIETNYRVFEILHSIITFPALSLMVKASKLKSSSVNMPTASPYVIVILLQQWLILSLDYLYQYMYVELSALQVDNTIKQIVHV